jgi:hypothetical protein
VTPDAASSSNSGFTVLPDGNGDVFLFQYAVPKSCVAGAKYGPKNAITRGCLTSNGAVTQAPAVTNCALLISQCDRFRTVPNHIVECPSGRHSLYRGKCPAQKPALNLEFCGNSSTWGNGETKVLDRQYQFKGLGINAATQLMQFRKSC